MRCWLLVGWVRSKATISALTTRSQFLAQQLSTRSSTQRQISNSAPYLQLQYQISIPAKQLSTQIPRLIPILQLNIPNPTHQFSTLSQFSNSTSCPTFKSKTQFQHLILIHQKQAHKLNVDQQCRFTFKYTKLWFSLWKRRKVLKIEKILKSGFGQSEDG